MSRTSETVLTIDHPAGLHLRPAALFVKTASRFKSDIQLKNLSREGSPQVDAKSMFGVMQSGVSRGHRIQIVATGADADQAIAALERLVHTQFEEQQ